MVPTALNLVELLEQLLLLHRVGVGIDRAGLLRQRRRRQRHDAGKRERPGDDADLRE